MPDALPFNRLDTHHQGWITLYLEGQAIQTAEGDTVAAALLAHGLNANRKTPVHNRNRAPYCMMGVCFECLVTIDGVENQQACMIQVKEGMQVQKQAAARQKPTADAVKEYTP